MNGIQMANKFWYWLLIHPRSSHLLGELCKYGFDLSGKPPVDLHCFFEISIRTEKKFQWELKKKFIYKLTEIFFQCSLKFFFSSRPITEKKFQWALKKNFSSFITEILSQFEINAKMDISKNQWRSTGG